jgi:hypothetical protein
MPWMLKLGKLKRGEKKEAEAALPRLPANPSQAQLKYKDESTRYIKLYGSGEYDFGITSKFRYGRLHRGYCFTSIVSLTN